MTFDAIGIAGSALTVHRKWLDAISDNLANMNTATSTSGSAFQARYIAGAGGPGQPGVYVAGAAARQRDRPGRQRPDQSARGRRRQRAVAGHRPGHADGRS